VAVPQEKAGSNCACEEVTQAASINAAAKVKTCMFFILIKSFFLLSLVHYKYNFKPYPKPYPKMAYLN
jgi:hypothetical protein